MCKRNVKYLIIRIVGIVLLVVGIVSALFFDKYDGHLVSYPFLFFIASIILCFLGGYLFYLPILRQENTSLKAYNKNKKWLKKKGSKLNVDLTTCTVKSHKEYIEKPRHSNPRTQAWDALYEPGRAIVSEERINSIVIYKTTLQDKAKTFSSERINKDEATVMFLIEHKKHTYIYYDEKNSDNYYFDLEFLQD